MTSNNLAPRFRSKKAYIKSQQYVVSELGRMHTEFDIRIAAFENGGNYDHFTLTKVGFSPMPYRQISTAVADVFENGGEFKLESFFSLLLTIYLDLYVRALQKNRDENEGTSRQLPSILPPDSLGDRLMMLSYCCNQSQLKNITALMLDLFDLGFVRGEETNLTQLFLFRLAEKEFGFEPRNWAADKYKWAVDPRKEEPLFQALWDHWDSDDHGLLTDLLTQLLNRHTFQASRNNKDGGRDFGAPAMEQVPWEVFFLYRLRKIKGLSNPVLNHRLMEPPFDLLPEPETHHKLCPRGARLLAAARKHFPDFDQLILSWRIRSWELLV
ncbi:MAG: hypothetical protein U5M23_13785 [Marinagarivorans sp.]|nr:hypothetical protein [Marinagarivorans sp.]